MARWLDSVPEFGEWDNRDPALPAPRNLYRDLIGNVAVFGVQYTRQSANFGSGYPNSSGASSSYTYQTSSDGSSGSASAATTGEFFAHDHELTKIARQMVNDGYARRMVTEFSSSGPDRAPLKTWFLELDVDWVLQIDEELRLPRYLQGRSAGWLQELVDRWMRALTVIAVSMSELVMVVTVDEKVAVARFAKESMAKMFVFVDALVTALKEERLWALLDMYVCVSSVSNRFASYRFASYRFFPEAEAKTILSDIRRSLSREVISLRGAISGTMRALFTELGRGKVHWITQFMVDCMTPMVKAEGLMRNTTQSHDTANLRDLIDDSVRYLKDLLLRKSEHSSDPSRRYLFLLNNFYSVEQLCATEPRPGDHSVLPHECKKFTDTYLDVSWGHVLSHIRETDVKDTCLDVSCRLVLLCIPKTGFYEWRQHRKKISTLAKFEAAFHKTYQAQKFWKVPDPQLRDMLRKAITEKVISEYRNYLTKHPELEKHVSSSPDVLKEMLGELFEG